MGGGRDSGGAPMGDEYAAILRQREERRAREEGERVAEAQAAKRRSLESSLRAKAEDWLKVAPSLYYNIL